MSIYPEGNIQGIYICRPCIYLCLWGKKLSVSENAYISIIEIMFKINFKMFIHEILGNKDSCFINDIGKVGDIILDEKLTQRPKAFFKKILQQWLYVFKLGHSLSVLLTFSLTDNFHLSDICSW